MDSITDHGIVLPDPAVCFDDHTYEPNDKNDFPKVYDGLLLALQQSDGELFLKNIQELYSNFKPCKTLEKQLLAAVNGFNLKLKTSNINYKGPKGFTENGFYSSDIVTFTVLSLDNPPTLNQFNNQMVGFNDNFDEINLNEYLNEVDNDDIEWSYTFISDINDEEPLLTINPSDFELSMTITAIIEALGVDTQGPDHVLYAFSGPELRGIATPIQALNEWVYFLTVYSNINGDELEFKLYDNLSSRLLPINYSLNFTANNSIGSPQNLLELQAGQI